MSEISVFELKESGAEFEEPLDAFIIQLTAIRDRIPASKRADATFRVLVCGEYASGYCDVVIP